MLSLKHFDIAYTCQTAIIITVIKVVNISITLKVPSCPVWSFPSIPPHAPRKRLRFSWKRCSQFLEFYIRRIRQYGFFFWFLNTIVLRFNHVLTTAFINSSFLVIGKLYSFTAWYLIYLLLNMWVVSAAAVAKLLQSCPTVRDPIDGSPPGSAVPGILQARTLVWVAISFSNAWKWKVKVKSLSCVWLILATPWTAAHQAPPSMGFSRQEYWSGVPWPSPI